MVWSGGLRLKELDSWGYLSGCHFWGPSVLDGTRVSERARDVGAALTHPLSLAVGAGSSSNCQSTVFLRAVRCLVVSLSGMKIFAG